MLELGGWGKIMPREMSGMSTSTSSTESTAGTLTPAASPAARVVSPPPNAPSFFAALGNPLRWQMLKLMVQHGPLCASQMATMLKRDFDGVSKHLRVMRTAGVVRAIPGDDRRLLFFSIPTVNQPEAGLLDYGTVRLDLRAPAVVEETPLAVRA
jgi:DNA-binding transcriptional ArsR family regulator